MIANRDLIVEKELDSYFQDTKYPSVLKCESEFIEHFLGTILLGAAISRVLGVWEWFRAF